MTSEAPIRVLVADDDALLRETIIDVLTDHGRFEVVAAVGDTDAAIRAAAEHHPDVALVDVRMPGGGGSRIARELRTRAPSTHVVALSSRDDRDAIVDMFGAGAASYLVKGQASNTEIVQTLLAVAAGRLSIPAGVGRQVLEELSRHLGRAQDEDSRHHVRTERVRRVLAAGEIAVAYQAIFDLETGRRVGAEALSRFVGPPRQGPDHWFADAAAVGLGVELESLAVHCALRGIEPPATDDVYIAVNVAPATALDQDVQAAVLGHAPDRVVLEITEHAPIDDYAAFQRGVEPLRAAGVRLAVDDAGAGFASLRHIVSLAPDIIKLDLSLTRDIDVERSRRAMARALISYAAESEVIIVAEGIETPAECQTLRQLGVSCGQGYLLGRPGAATALTDAVILPNV